MDTLLEFLLTLFNIFLHLDEYLGEIIRNYGAWSYGILFLIIFLETGVVIAPFLPGDSLIFAAGTFAGMGDMNLWLVFVLLSIAAVLGDTANYWIGHTIGPKAFSGNVPFLKKEYLDRTHAFYEKHGGKTIILARFVPIVRTFAPFVAGVGAMSYTKFISYNVIGGILWVAIFTFGGYFFGQLPIVQDNFSLVALGIIAISVLPAVYEFGKEWLANRKTKA